MTDNNDIGDLNEMLNNSVQKYNKLFTSYKSRYNRYRGTILKSTLTDVVELSKLLIQYYEKLNEDPNIGMIDDNVYIEPPRTTNIINGKLIIE